MMLERSRIKFCLDKILLFIVYFVHYRRVEKAATSDLSNIRTCPLIHFSKKSMSCFKRYSFHFRIQDLVLLICHSGNLKSFLKLRDKKIPKIVQDFRLKIQSIHRFPQFDFLSQFQHLQSYSKSTKVFHFQGLYNIWHHCTGLWLWSLLNR